MCAVAMIESYKPVKPLLSLKDLLRSQKPRLKYRSQDIERNSSFPNEESEHPLNSIKSQDFKQTKIALPKDQRCLQCTVAELKSSQLNNHEQSEITQV